MQSHATAVEQRDGQFILFMEITDEALEAAAGTADESYTTFTVAACTGLAACPS